MHWHKCSSFAAVLNVFVAPLMLSSAAMGQLPPAGRSSPPDSPQRAVEETVKAETVRAAYLREFGLTIEYPAIYNNPNPVDCLGNRHPPLTTTAYLTTGTITTLYTMYLSEDGRVASKTSLQVRLAPPARFECW